MPLRSKTMSIGEWCRFQMAYEALFVTCGGDEEMALFARRDREKGEHLLLITERHSERVESLSPGGWADREQACQTEWELLVGHANAPQRFGIRLDKRC